MIRIRRLRPFATLQHVKRHDLVWVPGPAGGVHVPRGHELRLGVQEAPRWARCRWQPLGKMEKKPWENGDFMEIFMKNYRKMLISWWFNGEDGDFIEDSSKETYDCTNANEVFYH